VTVAPLDVARRVNAERLVVLAWPRAILLQLAHPLIAAGVAAHSSFRGGSGAALARLHHTIKAMLAITFGDDRARTEALDTIRAIHRRVNGTLAESCGPFEAGTRYSAEDPALLLWVHATLVESMLLVYAELVAPVTEDDRDAYCEESASAAIELGAREEDVPRTWRALEAYLDREYSGGRIVVCGEARRLADALMAPWNGTVGRRVLTPLLSLWCAGLLPAPIRSAYRLDWTPGRSRAFNVATWLLRLMRRGLPRALATWKTSRNGSERGGTPYVRTAATR